MLDISRTLDHFKGRCKNSRVEFLKGILWGEATTAKAGMVSERFRKRLSKTINLIPKVLVPHKPELERNKLLKNSLLNRHEEIQRRSFIPHLWINHSLIKPHYKSLVDHMGLENWKVLSLPNLINKMSWDDQVNKIREIIKRHQKETGGYDDMFGNIMDYIYCKSYGESYLFSIEGDLVIEGNGNNKDN